MDRIHSDSMWMDNPRGYRFSSVVWAGNLIEQRKNWLYTHFQNVDTTVISLDSLHYLAFAFSIRNTGHPQLVEIWRYNHGWKGHAMVVYGVDKGTILIADPNYPGKARQTKLDVGKFVPYSSGDNAANTGVDYPMIWYIANSAIVPVGDIEERWRQTFDGTIGNVPPNTFPGTGVFLLSGSNSSTLPDSIETSQDNLDIAATCPTCAHKLADDRTYIKLTDEQGKFISWSASNGILRLPTTPGTTRYGLTIYGYAGPGETNFGYIDFRWLTVKKGDVVGGYASSGPLDGHFRVEDGTSGQLVTTYLDQSLSVYAGATGEGVHGSFANNQYSFDTTYAAGSNSFTEQVRLGFNQALTVLTSFTITKTYLQPGNWTETTTVTGGGVPLDVGGSNETRLRFTINGADACNYITSVTNTYQRLDKDYRQTLESHRCSPSTKINIYVNKR